MLSGFTIVRNAVSLDYPIVPAIRSILEICDEVIVNVGQSADGTRDLVAAVRDPRVRIIDSVWDFSRGSGVLAQETERAMRACRGAWGLYIQADEGLHETGAAILQERVRRFDGPHPRVAQEWIAARRRVPSAPSVAPPRFRLEHLRLYASDWIERLTGARVFEYRNYVEV